MTLLTIDAPAAPDHRPPPAFTVETAHWGYAVRTTAGTPPLLLLQQALAGACGILLVIAAMGPLLPGAADGAGTVRLGLACVLGAAGLLLLRFASRGSVAHVEVDLGRGELREVVRHRAGRPVTLAAHGFDAVRSVEMGAVSHHRFALMVQVAGAREPITVAVGSLSDLSPLRRDLERDLMTGEQGWKRGSAAGHDQMALAA